MVEKSGEDARTGFDPVYLNCLREARFILGVWCCCFCYTVTFCYLYGYLDHEPLPASTGPPVAELVGPLESLNRDPETLTFPLGLGIPDWVFYGIALPWVICIAISFWYGLVLFAEDDLGAQAEASQTEDASEAEETG